MTPAQEIASDIRKLCKANDWDFIKLTHVYSRRFPDSLIITNTDTFFCEIKSKYDKTSPVQDTVHERLNQVKRRSFIAGSKKGGKKEALDDVKRFMMERGYEIKKENKKTIILF